MCGSAWLSHDVLMPSAGSKRRCSQDRHRASIRIRASGCLYHSGHHASSAPSLTPRTSDGVRYRTPKGRGACRVVRGEYQGTPPAAAVVQKLSLAKTNQMAKPGGKSRNLERGGLER
jgi:hypothetical protein